jgi:hypothetical protein
MRDMAAPRKGSKAKHAPDPNRQGTRRGGLGEGEGEFVIDDPSRPDGMKGGLTVNPEGGLNPKGHDYSEFPFTKLARLTKLLRGEDVQLQVAYWDAHDCLGWAGETFLGPRQLGAGAGRGSAGRKMEALPEEVSDGQAAEMLEGLLAQHGGEGEGEPEAPKKGRKPASKKAAPQPPQAIPPWLVPILLKVLEKILDRLMRDQG